MLQTMLISVEHIKSADTVVPELVSDPDYFEQLGTVWETEEVGGRAMAGMISRGLEEAACTDDCTFSEVFENLGQLQGIQVKSFSEPTNFPTAGEPVFGGYIDADLLPG